MAVEKIEEIIMRKIITCMSIGIISISYLTFSAASLRISILNSSTETEGQWVYSGRTSYQGSNSATANGDASGYGGLKEQT